MKIDDFTRAYKVNFVRLRSGEAKKLQPALDSPRRAEYT